METVGVLNEAATLLNRQLTEAIKASNATELVRHYTAFFTSFNLLIGYAHLKELSPKKYDAEAFKEQLEVAKSALEAFSKDNRALLPLLAKLNGEKAERKGKTEGQDKKKKGAAEPAELRTTLPLAPTGGYEELVQAIEAKFGAPEQRETRAVVVGAGDGAPTYQVGHDIDRYYMRIYTVYQLLLRDLEKLALESEEKRRDYVSRVLPTRLLDLVRLEDVTGFAALEVKPIETLLAMSAFDYLSWLKRQLNLEHYVKEQRISLTQFLRDKGYDRGVKEVITHPVVRAVASLYLLLARNKRECRQAALSAFERLDALQPAQLAEATQALIASIEELQGMTGKIREQALMLTRALETHVPDLPGDFAVSGALAQPVKLDPALFKDPNRLPEIRKALGDYAARLDQAIAILKPLESYYIEMITTMENLIRVFRQINGEVLRWRVKLVDAYVQAALLPELWRYRVRGLEPELVKKQKALAASCLARLESLYPFSGSFYGPEGLDLEAVEELLKVY